MQRKCCQLNTAPFKFEAVAVNEDYQNYQILIFAQT